MNSLNPFLIQPETTGRYLVLLPEDEIEAGMQTLRDSAGISSVARTAESEGNALPPEQLQGADTVVFDQLGVAVVTLEPEQLRSINAATTNTSPILALEPERVVYALSDIQPGRMGQPPSSALTHFSADYLRGYRDAVVHLVDNLLGEQAEALVAPLNEVETTWGLQVTKVVNSPIGGRGIRVAVLDTGFDFTHPDFTGRSIIGKSFIPNEDAQDGNGHGTHVIGTACGSLSPPIPPRYGVGYETEIYVGKVLSNQGSGSDSGILAGIEWAISNGCQLISMSLGAPAVLGQPYSRVFEQVARRALRRGTLIIAAAGNESDRRTRLVNPVGHPANCPSIMAVAAIDRQLQVAFFSNGGLNPLGGQIDIAAPGVDIYSSWLMPLRYRTISGTSMATPHVSGIAALYAQTMGATGQELWNLLIQTALRLPLPATDVGAGLVQAPVDVC
ncbi:MULTISPECIES: S8 family peptidase [unclassified Coleofasciculus]|uniref:S8 family peptidase n=1 Tax=unclassified Coleofasciculus TaxID=2692782 RepID=UPI00187F5961|nr:MULTISPECIES: S8 family serine peptidase [unclassified Coleofasciculus]MBE9124624.1 S8 family serine peptidase [Coleofasciculus sp. LEGE 07081]MBE9147588.1 S8 family serine peptidase [Coleofasciculus sp. LEGE 07092]